MRTFILAALLAIAMVSFAAEDAHALTRCKLAAGTYTIKDNTSGTPGPTGVLVSPPPPSNTLHYLPDWVFTWDDETNSYWWHGVGMSFEFVVFTDGTYRIEMGPTGGPYSNFEKGKWKKIS